MALVRFFGIYLAFFISLLANATHPALKELAVVEDPPLLRDFSSRYNLALLLALHLESPAPSIATPKAVHKDGLLYISLPSVSSAKSYSLQTRLGALTLERGRNNEAYLVLKSELGYDIASELHGSVLYLAFLGTTTVAKELLEAKPSLQPATTASLSPTKGNESTDTTKPDSSSIKDSNFGGYEVSTWRYLALLAIMLALIIVLYLVRMRQNKGTRLSSISIEQAKILDSKNKIVVVSLSDTKYVLGLNPNGITLIDKLPTEESKKLEEEIDFSKLLLKQEQK